MFGWEGSWEAAFLYFFWLVVSTMITSDGCKIDWIDMGISPANSGMTFEETKDLTCSFNFQLIAFTIPQYGMIIPKRLWHFPRVWPFCSNEVNSAEAMDKDELSKFRGVLKVDMTQSSIVQIMKLLSDLEDLDVFGIHMEVDQLMGEERLLQALHAAKKVESDLAEAGKSKEKPTKPAATAPWYWALQLEQGSSEKLLQAWEGSEDYVTASASGIESKSEHHVTMLYLGGGKDEEVAARNPRLSGPQQVATLKEEFKQRQGEALSLEVPRIVWEDGRVAAAAVVLPDQLRQLCANDFLTSLSASPRGWMLWSATSCWRAGPPRTICRRDFRHGCGSSASSSTGPSWRAGANRWVPPRPMSWQSSRWMPRKPLKLTRSRRNGWHRSCRRRCRGRFTSWCLIVPCSWLLCCRVLGEASETGQAASQGKKVLMDIEVWTWLKRLPKILGLNWNLTHLGHFLVSIFSGTPQVDDLSHTLSIACRRWVAKLVTVLTVYNLQNWQLISGCWGYVQPITSSKDHP